MTGVLSGIRVVEIGGLGPAPFCAMMLADHGAHVLRVERPDKQPLAGAEVRQSLVSWDIVSRGRLSAGIDLKHPDGPALIERLCATADVFIEGFRPGVAERLGVGPERLRGSNDRLVYGRMTGWGRTGPLAERAGHDINYLSVAGVQAHIGRSGAAPTPPLNLVGDYGGGGMLLAFGVCAALVERSISGRGQVVDAAMLDGSALLMGPLYGAHSSGFWYDDRGTNLLDSGAPFYDCYECSDGGYVSVGAIEPQFFAALIAGLELSESELADLPDQSDQTRWPELRAVIAAAFLRRTRDDWAQRFATVDACVAPVLTMGEAPGHPQAVASGTFITIDGVPQPAPAPRFDRTAAGVPTVPQMPGANTAEALAAWGIDAAQCDELANSGVLG